MGGSVLHDGAQPSVEEHAQPADLVAVEHWLGVRPAAAILLPKLRVLPLLATLLYPFEGAAQRESRGLAGQHDHVRSVGAALHRRMHGRECGAKGEAAGFACREPDDQRLVGEAGEVFPREDHAVLRVAHRADRRRDVQIAGVSGRRCVAFEEEAQIA